MTEKNNRNQLVVADSNNQRDIKGSKGKIQTFQCEISEEKVLSNGDTVKILGFDFIPSKTVGGVSSSRLRLQLNLLTHLIFFEMVNPPSGGFSLIQAVDVRGNVLYKSIKWSIDDLCKWTGAYVHYDDKRVEELIQLVTRIRKYLKKNIKEKQTNHSIVLNSNNLNPTVSVLVKELSLKFCTEVEPLHPFNEKRWFQGAYQTMQRTKKGGVAQTTREDIMRYIFREIENLRVLTPSQIHFDKWFYDCVHYICSIGNLTLGQGQKIINILLKYYYCYYHAELNKNWNMENNHLQAFFCFFHAPVDSIILKQLKLKFDDNKINIIKITSQGSRFILGNEKIPWSKLENIELYRKVQYYIGELANTHLLVHDRVAFEMCELWLID